MAGEQEEQIHASVALPQFLSKLSLTEGSSVHDVSEKLPLPVSDGTPAEKHDETETPITRHDEKNSDVEEVSATSLKEKGHAAENDETENNPPLLYSSPDIYGIAKLIATGKAKNIIVM
jgi:hypothetical protein